MPTFNAQVTIGQAVDSVLDQGYAPLELIVVDDGSTDATLAQLARYGSRLHIISIPNAGPAAARNRGVAAATGELLAFLDADDVWLPGKLAAQVRYLQAHPDVAVVFGGFQRWEPQAHGRFAPPPETPLGQVPSSALTLAQPSGWIYADLLLDSVVHIITAMVRQPVFAQVGGFDETLPTGEDYDFWLRVSRTWRIDQLAQTLAWYRIHPASITQQPRAENNEYRVLLKTLQTFGSMGPDGRTVPPTVLQNRLFAICFGHAYLHFWHGQPQQARKAFAQALRHRFWRPKVWVYWVLSGIKALVGLIR